MPPAPIPQNEGARLTTLRSYAILDTPPEKVYDDMTQLASVMCDTPISTITFVDTNRQWFKSAVGVSHRQNPRAESFCAYPVAIGQSLVVEDTLFDPRFIDNPLVTCADGIRFYAGVPLIAPSGHVLGTICVIDTKPRTLAAEKLRALELLSAQIVVQLEARIALLESHRAAAALMHSDKLAAVGRHSASVSQEIKNPLETVSNLIYLSRQHVSDPEIQSWLDQAETEIHRVTAAINHSLRFGQQTQIPQSVDCLELISTVLALFEGRLKQAGISVEKRRRAGESVLCFDAEIRQVLGHLFANSIEAMPAGGRLLVRSRVSTRRKPSVDSSEPRQSLVITVADTGIGIPSGIRDKIVAPFFTTKDSGASGLGLWISTDIIRRHHGSLTIRSSQRPGHSGTVVSVSLPLRNAPDPVTVPVEDSAVQSALR